MSKNIPEILNPLKHAGTNKFERLAQEMEFSYVQIEERHESDFLLYAQELAKSIQYYDSSNMAAGTWESFYDLNLPENRPHRALFIAFVRLLEALNEHANGLSKRHLDYYYKEVLQFVRRESRPSQVHLFAECANTLKERFIAASSTLNAGKSENKQDLLFELVDDIVVNSIKVDKLFSVYRHDDALLNRLFSKDYSEYLQKAPAENKEGFPAFGEHQLSYKQTESGIFESEVKSIADQTMNPAVLGFAVSSPMLRLAEGDRTIKLRLKLSREKAEVFDLKQFEFQITVAEGWMNLDEKVVQSSSGLSEVLLEFTLNEADPTVSNHQRDVHQDTFQTNYPVLKITLTSDNDAYAYSKWKDVKLEDVGIKVSSKGVRSLIVQNELSTLDPAKPFRPFGPIPTIGSHFYVGHSEIFKWKLDSAKLNIQWKDLPRNSLGSYYSAYEGKPTNASFEVRTSILENRVWKNTSTQPIALFNDKAKERKTIPFDFSSYSRKNDEKEIIEWNHDVYYGFARITLVAPDLANFRAFGHSAYPNEVVRNSGSQNSVEQPYTPMIDDLTFEFESAEYFVSQNSADCVFHVAPFGEKLLEIEHASKVEMLFPQFKHEGELYIGLKDVIAPQSVNLLFQFIEGTGDASKSLLQSGIEWAYLSGNEWKSLDPLSISRDTTHNLLTTGIIRFDLSQDMNDQHTILPTGLFWLKAVMPSNTSGLDKLQNIHAQGFVIEEVDPDLSDKIIQPDTISKLTNGNKGISKIHQPYASFGGTNLDSEEIFYARSAERLRHKDRGIMIWDYERLVLDEFPDLYKVKCLNHTNDQTEMAAGNVMLAVVPNLRRKGVASPFQPKLSVRKRVEIYEYVKNKISPFVHLWVENPIYEPIRLSFSVGFHKGNDEGFYGRKLHQQLQEFLSPWAFESELTEKSDLVFGGELHKSVVLKFIEDLEYVDFVNDFNMYHIYQDPTIQASIEELMDQDEGNLASEFNASLKTEGPCDVIQMAIPSDDPLELTALVEVKVRFLKGIIAGDNLGEMFIEELHSAIKNRSNRGVVITKTLLRTLIKNIYYVDKIVELSFYKILPEQYVLEDVDVAIAKSSRSIMVTAEQHRIGIYRSGDHQCEGSPVIGIGFMVVEADFIIPSLNESN